MLVSIVKADLDIGEEENEVCGRSLLLCDDMQCMIVMLFGQLISLHSV